MSFYSVTDCCRLLAIDGKTLHRWVAQAHLPVQPHPTDARRKGLCTDDLRLLATTHHRSLPDLPAVPLPLAPTAHSQAPPLPPALLALLLTLSDLPAQLAAVQQQLADLLQRLDAQLSSSAVSAPTPRSHAAAPVPATTNAAAAARSRPTKARSRKPPPPPAHVLPRVEAASDGHYVVLCPTHGLLPFAPDSPQWFAWLATQSAFRFVGKRGRFTAHHEQRVPQGAWRAHRHIRNHSYTLRLAPSHELTLAVLEHAAEEFQAHLK